MADQELAENGSPGSYRSLPVLQSSLDGLHPAESLLLDQPQVERLFGYNDVAANRLKRFARSHQCIVVHTQGGVKFIKNATDASTPGS